MSAISNWDRKNINLFTQTVEVDQIKKKLVFRINTAIFQAVDHSIVCWLLGFLVFLFGFISDLYTQIYFPPYFVTIAELHSTCVAVNNFLSYWSAFPLFEINISVGTAILFSFSHLFANLVFRDLLLRLLLLLLLFSILLWMCMDACIKSKRSVWIDC